MQLLFWSRASGKKLSLRALTLAWCHGSYLLTYCENYDREDVLNNFGSDTSWYHPSSGLIEFCVAVGELQDVRRVLNLLSRTYLRYNNRKGTAMAHWPSGLRNRSSNCERFEKTYGWNTLKFEITSMLEQDLRVGQEHNFAHLMFELQDLMSFHDASSLILSRFEALGVQGIVGGVRMLRHDYSLHYGTPLFSREDYPS